MLSSTIFILTWSTLGFSKPILTETLQGAAGDPVAQIQADAILPEERIHSKSDVTRDLDSAPEMPRAHNRTTRQANNWCLLRIDRVWDNCRGQLVDRYQCRSQHVSCQQAIPKHNKPKCETVYGYPQAKFVSLCASLPIDCRCAV